jgi:Fic family protein
MTWNWQQPDWPQFTWEGGRLSRAEREFLLGGGVLLGTVKHLPGAEHDQLAVEAMSTEAVTTSEIEGKMLDRESVQSSIRRQLGLAADNRRAAPAEQGIAEMMVDLYRSFAAPLTEEMLFEWHRMLMAGSRGLADIGHYRRGEEPMQIVSGPVGEPKVHFEAPPSSRVPAEMERFIAWFERTGPGTRDWWRRVLLFARANFGTRGIS